MIGRYTYIPLGISLMIWPTIAYEIAVHEFPRTSITLRGFPLPWNGDALLGSGAPINVFIIPAIIDFAVYIGVCAIVWAGLYRRLEHANNGIRVPVVTLIWLYAALAVAFLGFGIWSGGSWLLWYESRFYDSLLSVGLSSGV